MIRFVILLGLGILLTNACIGQEPPASLLPDMDQFLEKRGWKQEDGFWMEDKGKWIYTADLKTKEVAPDTAVENGSAYMGTMSISLAYRETYFNKKGAFHQALTYCPVEYICEILEPASCGQLKKEYHLSDALEDDIVELREKPGSIKVILEGTKVARLKTKVD